MIVIDEKFNISFQMKAIRYISLFEFNIIIKKLFFSVNGEDA